MKIPPPTISLILPAYNTSKYLEKCVESCENQDIPKSEYEIIIVDDGSTDETASVAKMLAVKHNNITVIHQENQGVSVARNNGADNANGRYIWFIDSDDAIAENCLRTIVATMEHMRLDMFGVGPNIPFIPSFPDVFDRECQVTSVMTGREWILGNYFFCGPWAYVFRKTFWDNSRHRFFPNIYYEDSEAMPKFCFEAERIASFNSFSCYDYVQRSGSIMNSEMNEKKLMDIAVIINNHGDYIKSHLGDDPEAVISFERGRTAHYMAGVVNIAHKKDLLLLNRWLNVINDRPSVLYGHNLIEKVYQYVVVHAPRLYVRLRKYV